MQKIIKLRRICLEFDFLPGCNRGKLIEIALCACLKQSNAMNMHQMRTIFFLRRIQLQLIWIVCGI